MPKSKSSRKWLKEHFDDLYVKKAQEAGYRSRAVFKLQEIDDKDQLIKPGRNVVDLGAAPGGWTEYVREKLPAKNQVFALDILPMEPIEDVTIITGDFTSQEVLDQLLEALAGAKIDLVLSDMAPNISGMKAVDQPRAMYLAELALDFCQKALAPGGDFLVKVFQGEGFDEYLKLMRDQFQKVVVRKPSASRPRSREVYLLGRNYLA
jgi:23S rRNA (uridine2552-2'-O)-methyltransferase